MTSEQYVALSSAAVTGYLKACEQAGGADRQRALMALLHRVQFESMKAAASRTHN